MAPNLKATAKAMKKKVPVQRLANTASSFVRCPACEVHVAASLINLHLDTDCGSLKACVSVEKYRQETKKPSLTIPQVPVTPPLSLRLLPSPPVSGMKGYRLVEEFITAEEEQRVLHFLSMDHSNPWRLSTFSGLVRGKQYGLVAAFARRQVLPAEFDIPKCLEPIIDRMRTLSELVKFYPNELNTLEYIKAEGHFLRPHVDDRQLSGELIVNLSLCGECYMTFKREKGAYECHRIRLKPRSLQILSEDSRYSFSHSIANEDLLSPRRVSVTFREVTLT